MSSDVPLPEVNSDTRAWWDATRSKQLLLQRCRPCGHLQHYPRPLCLRCDATDLEFAVASGKGRVYSYSVVYLSPDPEVWEPPYVVALVDLEEGPRMFSSVVECEPSEVVCDMRVKVQWRPLSDGRHLPLFGPDKVARIGSP